jgi:hypothetical protein
VTVLARPGHADDLRSLFDGPAVSAHRTTATDPGQS